MANERDRMAFDRDPEAFIERTIKDFVATSKDNRLRTFDNQVIFDEPLIGFAAGDDPLFEQYKTLIGSFHLTPQEALSGANQGAAAKDGEARGSVSVVSWIMPINKKTLETMRGETKVASLQWNHTRWHGQALIDALSRHLVTVLESMGHTAVAPERSPAFKMVNLDNGLASNWSQRHVAFAAGLGTFGLSDGFITPRGIALRAGSVVVSTKLSPSHRTHDDPYANCLHHRGVDCMQCAKRCPVDAISEEGHDKKKCMMYVLIGQRAVLDELGRARGYVGDYVGCGLCQTKVPCEHCIPRTVDA